MAKKFLEIIQKNCRRLLASHSINEVIRSSAIHESECSIEVSADNRLVKKNYKWPLVRVLNRTIHPNEKSGHKRSLEQTVEVDRNGLTFHNII